MLWLVAWKIKKHRDAKQKVGLESVSEMLETYSISVDKFFVLGSLDRWGSPNWKMWTKDISKGCFHKKTYTNCIHSNWRKAISHWFTNIPHSHSPPKKKDPLSSLFTLTITLSPPPPLTSSRIRKNQSPSWLEHRGNQRDGSLKLEDSDFPKRKMENWKMPAMFVSTRKIGISSWRTFLLKGNIPRDFGNKGP